MHTASWSLAPSWLTTVSSSSSSDVKPARGLLDDWLLPRSPRAFETSVPGVFAVGDVRSRSMKRVASSVGEGSGSIKEIHHYLESKGKWAALRRSPA